MNASTLLSSKVAKYLELFCDESNKTAAFADPRDFDRFCKFAVSAHSENASFEPEALLSYLKSKQWPDDQADVVAKRYKAARHMLSMYDQVKSGAQLL